MILNFGKYKGYSITDVPDDYLSWLITKLETDLIDYRAEAIRREAVKEAKLSWIERIVQAGFRTLTLSIIRTRAAQARI